MLTFEEFKEKCKTYCPRNTNKSKRCSLESKKKDCFRRYKNLKLNSKPIIDLKWKEIQEIVNKRDSKCRVLPVLSVKEYGIIKYQLKGLSAILDCAHVISRAQAPQDELYYNPDNIVLMSRMFHARLDTYKDPVTDKFLTKEQRNHWWERIVGKKMWNKLLTLQKELS